MPRHSKHIFALILKVQIGRIILVKGIGMQVFGDRSSGIKRAKTYEWLFFEQYSHEPFIAVARFIQYYQKMPTERIVEYKECHVHWAHALNVVEHNLAKHGFFGGDDPSIADIALFAYTPVAEQVGFELRKYPAITRWINDMKSLSGYTPITERLD